MAQFAAVEALASLVGQRSQSLYGTTSAEVRSATYQFSTHAGFAILAHELFARFTQRFLTYHLSRELSNHVGGNGRFSDPADHTEFVEQLGIHCHEMAAIMRRYAGDWYSKYRFLDGVSLGKARQFTRYALKKIGAELTIRGERDG